MSVAGRPLPMLEIVPPSRGPGAAAPEPEDERLGEFRPESRALPAFFVWTLGCQMNRSDSEEMAGRLLAAGCAEAGSMEGADLIVINTCAIRETAEAKVVGRQGQLAALRAANPALRVVLTGCSVREMDRQRLARRFPAVDLFLRPDEEPELVDRLGLASAQGPVGMLGVPAGTVGATTIVGRTAVGVADHLAGTRADAVGAGAVRRGSSVSAWLPIIYGCDKTCTYCIVPFSRGPERSRPFDEIVAEARSLAAAGYREVTLLGQNVNSYGHDLPPERRFAHVDTARWAGRRLELGSRPDLAELIRAIDGLRAADGAPAIPRLRFITSHPWDLSDRLIDAMAECPSVCEALHLPVQSGDDAVLRRMGRQYSVASYRERLDRIRAAVPGIAISTDVIVGFCGETDAQFRSTLGLLEDVGYDQVFAAAYSQRPGTPATRLADDVPADEKRARLNELLALQEPIGLERNRSWIGRTTEVLLDTIVPPRSHDHDPDEPEGRDGPSAPTLPATEEASPSMVHLSGRTRQNKLVHVEGPRSWLGRLVQVRVEHAGPYSLRGSVVA
ncbi:MAG TPA: MiaB/RimO family radical SAM methylthiotransferase [Candidatus Limnocylindrales bacterium]|nr:MiaB/RimO family radical SAM methylthiotransferase [Candidatus Limnocylindrales bacterium]